MSNNKNSELNDIIEGFKLFGSETGGIINPSEIKDIMEIMNMNESNPFLYKIISDLCLNEEIQKKGGINADDFISILDQELNDISSMEGLQKIFSIFSDVNEDKINLPIISQILNQNRDWGLGNDEEKIKKLISRPELVGNQINFDDFQKMMKTENDNENNNLIYMKKSHINSKNQIKQNNIINNNINILNNNNNKNNQFSNLDSEISLEKDKSNINITSNKYEDDNEDKNKINNISELNYVSNINNFDYVASQIKIENEKNEKSKSKKKYRYMHKSPNNKNEKSYENEEKELKEKKIINNITYKNKNLNKEETNINNNKEENFINKEDKTEKRYHRRYRDIKSPKNKQKEDICNDNSDIEENTDNKISTNYWRYRRKK